LREYRGEVPGCPGGVGAYAITLKPDPSLTLTLILALFTRKPQQALVSSSLGLDLKGRPIVLEHIPTN